MLFSWLIASPRTARRRSMLMMSTRMKIRTPLRMVLELGAVVAVGAVAVVCGLPEVVTERLPAVELLVSLGEAIVNAVKVVVVVGGVESANLGLVPKANRLQVQRAASQPVEGGQAMVANKTLKTRPQPKNQGDRALRVLAGEHLKPRQPTLLLMTPHLDVSDPPAYAAAPTRAKMGQSLVAGARLERGAEVVEEGAEGHGDQKVRIMVVGPGVVAAQGARKIPPVTQTNLEDKVVVGALPTVESQAELLQISEAVVQVADLEGAHRVQRVLQELKHHQLRKKL